MKHVAKAFLPTKFGKFNVHAFADVKLEHLAIVKEFSGTPHVRVHSKCLTGDGLCSLRCDCREQLEASLKHIENLGGMVIYLDQEGRGIGLANKIRAYELQDQGMDTVDANVHLGFGADEREYSAVASILGYFKIREIALLTNNPDKISGLERVGIKVIERIPLIIRPNEHNGNYLKTKRERMGHAI